MWHASVQLVALPVILLSALMPTLMPAVSATVMGSAFVVTVIATAAVAVPTVMAIRLTII